MRLNRSTHAQRSQTNSSEVLRQPPHQELAHGQSQNRNPAVLPPVPRDKSVPAPAVPSVNVMSNEQRKVLEEIQKTKNLLKQGAGAGLQFPSTAPTATNNHFSAPGGTFGDLHMSPLQRTAMQTLQQANATSFGSFVSTDSHFGNGILPVLPRLTDPNITKPDLKPPAKPPVL